MDKDGLGRGILSVCGRKVKREADKMRRIPLKKQLLRSVFVITAVWLLICAGYLLFMQRKEIVADRGEKLVLLNEVEQLTKNEDGSNPAQAEIEELRETLKEDTPEGKRSYTIQVTVTCGVIIFFYMLFIFFYLYRKMLAPFQKLEQYAGELAKGNLDVSLDYERTNFFGAFTWAFDHMREELIRARKREEYAIQENKTIIATLSHDIKTPIASIRAYAEALEANLESGYEKRQQYASVILKKCDEVTGLTNDLVLHSLSELEHLEIEKQQIQMDTVLEEICRDFAYEEVVLDTPFPRAELCLDEKRLAQVIENLLNNARKYAPGTKIEVSAQIRDGKYEIHVRDHGKGILPQDMPFICEKFYRGKNTGDAPGSGLGLYIVTYILKRMDGELKLRNHADGLDAVVTFELADAPGENFR